MISLGYTMAYLLRNPLPWQRSSDKELHQKGICLERIAAIKLQYSGEKLFEGLPTEFADYMTVSFDKKKNHPKNQIGAIR